MTTVKTLGSVMAVRTVLYCTDIAGRGGSQRHREAITRGLSSLGWSVRHVEGIVGLLRRARGSREGSSGVVRASLLKTVVLLANTALRAVPLFISCLVDRPDVVLWRPGAFQKHGVWVARLLGLPLVVELNAPVTEGAGYRLMGLATRIEMSVLRSADEVLAVSEENARWAERLGCASAAVVRNGGGFADADEVWEAEAWEAGCPICARPSSERRFAVVLESFRTWHGDEERRTAIASLPDGWHTLVIGDGPGLGDFKRWALDEALPVSFFGRLPSAATQHLLVAHADLGFVLYPPTDDFYFSPLKLYDFLAHDIDVVATDIGQISLLGRPSGPRGTSRLHLVRPGDEDELVSTVERVTRWIEYSPRRRTGSLDSRYGWQRASMAYGSVLHRAIGSSDDRYAQRAEEGDRRQAITR